MHFSEDKEIEDLVKRFENRTLTKAEWTHAAHLTVGLHYCLNNPFGVAKNLMRDGIHWLNDKHGTPNTDSSGYHETLTVFWLEQVMSFVRAHREETKVISLANRMIAKLGDRELPFQTYTRTLLLSPRARARYVEPDITKLTIHPIGRGQSRMGDSIAEARTE